MAFGVHRVIRASLAGAAVVAMLAACSSDIVQRGNPADPDELAGITPGETTYRDVASVLGSPSTVGNFKTEVWYYISSQTVKTAFFKPTVLDRQVIAIAFDGAGRVASVDHYGMDDARDIEPVGRVTPTSGKELSFIQQVLGNIGRFANTEGPAN